MSMSHPWHCRSAGNTSANVKHPAPSATCQGIRVSICCHVWKDLTGMLPVVTTGKRKRASRCESDSPPRLKARNPTTLVYHIQRVEYDTPAPSSHLEFGISERKFSVGRKIMPHIQRKLNLPLLKVTYFMKPVPPWLNWSACCTQAGEIYAYGNRLYVKLLNALSPEEDTEKNASGIFNYKGVEVRS
jgi:hypothetical protein